MIDRTNNIPVQVIRSRRRTLGLQIRDAKVIVRAPFQVPEREIRRFLDAQQAWIRKHLDKAQQQKHAAQQQGILTDADVKELAQKARLIIPERVRFYAPQIGVTYGKITIRSQTSRWGSCSSRGNLNFNCLLLLTPPEVLDSVVVHELCHRKEMNHSRRFYGEVLRVYPEYFQWHRWLTVHGGVLMERLKAGKEKTQKGEYYV